VLAAGSAEAGTSVVEVDMGASRSSLGRPASALGQHIAEHLDAIGHDAINTEIK
jgi:hypothetical protein